MPGEPSAPGGVRGVKPVEGRPAHGSRCTPADYVLETVFWDAGIARLLPRLQHAAQAGPGTGWDRTSTDTPV